VVLPVADGGKGKKFQFELYHTVADPMLGQATFPGNPCLYQAVAAAATFQFPFYFVTPKV
jgi:hypothetical protein